MAALYTCDAAAWYRRLGWIDERFQPVQGRVDDPAVAWLEEHPEVQAVFGSYWDVYRLSFLRAGKLKGVPFPIFPNRFPEWSDGLPGGRPETLLVRRSPEGQLFLNSALREGGEGAAPRGGDDDRSLAVARTRAAIAVTIPGHVEQWKRAIP